VLLGIIHTPYSIPLRAFAADESWEKHHHDYGVMLCCVREFNLKHNNPSIFMQNIRGLSKAKYIRTLVPRKAFNLRLFVVKKTRKLFCFHYCCSIKSSLNIVNTSTCIFGYLQRVYMVGGLFLWCNNKVL
jgi:hypothetical protein